MKYYLLFFAAVFGFVPATVNAQEAFTKQTRILRLGETAVKINIYEKAGSKITFFAPHHNEQTALKLGKEIVRGRGGRLIEIESFDKRGNPARRVAFVFAGESYTIDPNRIFTANGRRCAGFAGKVEQTIRNFAEELLEILYSTGNNPSSDVEKFVVALHNNHDVENVAVSQRANDLTAAAFVKNIPFGNAWRGAFAAQAAGVYLSNDETDADNFIFLSTPRFVGHFAGHGFNVVVQKPFDLLLTEQCAVDDGSLSVYAGQQKIEYICLEADQSKGNARQKQMFESVYQLLN
jgi:hypothetical protein